MRSLSWRGIALVCGILAAPAAAPAAACRFEEGRALIAAGKSAEARPILEDCAKGGSHRPEAAFALGQICLFGRDENGAVLWFERAASLAPENSEYQFWLGRAYGAQALRAVALRQPALARKVRRAFERAVDLDPANLSARLALVQYGLQAPGFMGGSVERARVQAEEIRSRDRLKGHHAFGLIAEHEKRYDMAAKEYESAMRDFPDSLEPVYWRVDLARRQKDFEVALDLLETRTVGKRIDPEALYLFGEVAASSGLRLDRGEENLKRYLEHSPVEDEPSLASAHLQLGLIYERKKDRALARREYAAALELDPTLTQARQALARK
jgi:tetratricopeptide (TPR) repeat protein